MQNVENFRASRNDLRASTSWLQLVPRAGWKIKLLCTLRMEICSGQISNFSLAGVLYEESPVMISLTKKIMTIINIMFSFSSSYHRTC